MTANPPDSTMSPYLHMHEDRRFLLQEPDHDKEAGKYISVKMSTNRILPD